MTFEVLDYVNFELKCRYSSQYFQLLNRNVSVLAYDSVLIFWTNGHTGFVGPTIFSSHVTL